VLETVPFVLIDQVARPAIVDIFTQVPVIDACCVKTYFQDALLALLQYQYLVKHAQLLIL
jgi:hypothetical protein